MHRAPLGGVRNGLGRLNLRPGASGRKMTQQQHPCGLPTVNGQQVWEMLILVLGAS